MAYVMINTTEGEPITVIEMRSSDISEIPWVEGAHCANEIAHIQIRGAHIIFMNKERAEFASLSCQDHEEAKIYALANFGYMVEFDDTRTGGDMA